MDLSKYKQYAPFAIIGVVAGLFTLMSKKSNGGSASSSSNVDEGLNDIKGVMKENQQATDQQFREYSSETNQAFKEQKYYYDNLVKDMTSNFNDTTKTLTGKIDELTKANTTLTNEYNDLSSKLQNGNNNSGGGVIVIGGGGQPPTPAPSPVPLSKQQRDELYKQTYDIVNQAMKSNDRYDYEAARYAVDKMKASGIDMVTPDTSAVGEFSKQLDKVQDKNGFVRKYEPM